MCVRVVHIPAVRADRQSHLWLTIAQLAEHLTVVAITSYQSVLGSIPSGES